MLLEILSIKDCYKLRSLLIEAGEKMSIHELIWLKNEFFGRRKIGMDITYIDGFYFCSKKYQMFNYTKEQIEPLSNSENYGFLL